MLLSSAKHVPGPREVSVEGGRESRVKKYVGGSTVLNATMVGATWMPQLCFDAVRWAILVKKEPETARLGGHYWGSR